MFANCIVNASPLVFLGNAGKLEWLRGMSAGRVVVPEAVFGEVSGSLHCDRASAALKRASWIERKSVESIPASVAAWDLGPGESEVIALGLQHPGATLVVDDLAGRKCALSLGLEVVGTIGVVVAAYRRGEVADLTATFTELRAGGMWISDQVIAHAVALATARPPKASG